MINYIHRHQQTGKNWKLWNKKQKTMKGHKHSLNKYHQWADEVQVGKEAEQREERKWKKIFFIMALCVSLSFCAVFFVTCSLFETATILLFR